MVFLLVYKMALFFFPSQSGELQMNQVVPESPGRIVTQEKQRREKCKKPYYLFVL